ncbi:MAG: hypothetical protein IJA44_03910 [Clostridia bacterium]|nr:hypothetical protein [Clostridia bacterium]
MVSLSFSELVGSEFVIFSPSESVSDGVLMLGFLSGVCGFSEFVFASQAVNNKTKSAVKKTG